MSQHLLQDCVCAQRWLRSACAAAQSDQSLRCPPEDALGPWLPQSVLRRLLSDCAEAQADLSIRFAHMQFCRKCCVPAHFTFRYAYKVSYILVNFIDIFWKLDNTIPSNFYFCVGKDRRGLEKKKKKKKKKKQQKKKKKKTQENNKRLIFISISPGDG